MELFEERDNFIIQAGEHALWCNRFDGSLTAKRGSDICNAWNPICLGKVHGVIGKMKIHPETEWKLLLIRQRTHVGKLPDESDVYCINRVIVLPLCLDEPKDLDIELCEKHHFGISKPAQITKVPEAGGKGFTKTWNSIKNAAESVKPKKLPFKLPQNIGSKIQQNKEREIKEKEKFERRILDELMKMFNDSDSFYYSPTGDLTNSVQRQHEKKPEDGTTDSVNTDDRFFWNKHMLQDLINSDNPLAAPWLIPIIQGYVQIEKCQLEFEEESPDSYKDPLHSPIDPTLQYTITLISRRSRYRAGTRYKRRGVDEEGHCANYVETEQIMQFMHHQVSFVQVRGSVPVFWSQTGIKYKPPPRIEKGEKENTEAFVKHMNSQVDQYGKVAVVNLVDQAGKEKVIQDAFLQHIVQFNHKQVTYVAFDFHEYCRGMKFENVSILVDNIKDIIKEVRYCWVDKKGMICDQLGVFRVNCIDCLDRTNVVQSAIARIILETQCRKLGLLPPDEHLPSKCRQSYQQIWANNGDAISRQYAGTAALKGDYTRTGERKFTGLMKDGMNSANRYYLNRFKDLYRQATIDLMLGNPITEDLMVLTMTREGSPGEEEDASLVEKEENMKTLIDECKKMLITEPEDCLGGWGLIDADPVTGDPTQQDMDIILLLSQRAYYIANYDDEKDQVTSYQKIYLEDLDRIEIGPSPSLFKSKHICIRMYYNVHGDVSYFHTLRTTGTRLFNNMIIHIKNDEEARESLKAITESFNAARKLVGMDLEVKDCKLDRRRSKPHDVIDIASEAQRSSMARNPFPLSRESSGINLRDVIPPPARNLRPKINISKIGKTFQGFNIINKVKINRSKGGRIAGFMPAVWYSKEASEAEEQGSKEEVDGVSESAKILKGDHIITAQETFKKGKLQKRRSRKLSIDEIEAIFEETDEIKEMMEKGGLEIEAEETDLDVLLDSCGILATRPTEVLNTLVQTRKTKSLDMLHFLALEAQERESKGIRTKPKSPRMPLRTMKDNLVAASMTRSLDFDDLKPHRRVVSEGFSSKQIKIGLPTFQEVLNQDSMDSSSVSSESDGEAITKPSDIHFTIGTSEKNGLVENGLEAKFERSSESKVDQVPEIKTTLDDSEESFQKRERNDKMNVTDDANGPATLTATDITAETERREEEDAFVVIPNESEKQKRSTALFHPSMKMSLSDGSISYHQNADELTIKMTEPTDEGAGPTTSAFSKFKVKMSNLALPTIPFQQAKRQAQEDMAADNRLKSQLQYRHLDTKILLL